MRIKVSFSKSNNTFSLTQYDNDGSVELGTLRETDAEYWTDVYIEPEIELENHMPDEFGDSA